MNALLVRWAEGYHEVVDAASVSAYGRHEDFLSAGQAQSVAEAERIALGLLARWAWPTEAIIIAVEPTGTDDVPFVDFFEGDTVEAPDATGAPTTYRVDAISVSEDGEGNPFYTPELVAEEGGS